MKIAYPFSNQDTGQKSFFHSGEQTDEGEPVREQEDILEQLNWGGQIVFEPVQQNPYDLSYTCVLIPRFSSHYLLGDISLAFQTVLRQICISFGWRLEYVGVNPEYLQWTIRVQPATSTAYFMKVIRQHTSAYVFENFPRFKKENLSDDFWAPGYLIALGSHPHPTDMIREFIRQTRQQQGILPNG